MTADLLKNFASALVTGGVKIVDLTATLSPETPTLPLPTEFGWGESWPFSMETISRYDEKGPAWYWNNLRCGEHTGTHFDAPIHWVTGKDHENHATDTLPPERFVAPAVVIDAVAESAANPDFLMTVDFIREWESRHGEIPAGAWVLYRTDWSKKVGTEGYLNVQGDGSIPLAGIRRRWPFWLRSVTSSASESRQSVPIAARPRLRNRCSPATT